MVGLSREIAARSAGYARYFGRANLIRAAKTIEKTRIVMEQPDRAEGMSASHYAENRNSRRHVL